MRIAWTTERPLITNYPFFSFLLLYDRPHFSLLTSKTNHTTQIWMTAWTTLIRGQTLILPLFSFQKKTNYITLNIAWISENPQMQTSLDEVCADYSHIFADIFCSSIYYVRITLVNFFYFCFGEIKESEDTENIFKDIWKYRERLTE